MTIRSPGLLLLACFFGFGLLAPPSLAAGPADFPEILFGAPWHGSYVCSQGLTRLQLLLRPLPGPDDGRVEADFIFSVDPGNPTASRGAFRLSGRLDRAAQTVTLKQERWLEGPPDPSYRMVDLAGKFQLDGNRALLQGKITSYGCQDFTVWQFFSAGLREGKP